MIFFTHVPVKDMENNLDMKPHYMRHIFANPLALCFIVVPLMTQQKMGKVDVHVVGYLTCSCVALRIRFKISRQFLAPGLVNENHALSCTYCRWLIKSCSTYFIFPVIGATLIQEQHLFQLQVKHQEEYRENYVRCIPGMPNLNFNKYTLNCYMNLVSRGYIKTLELTSWSKSCIAIWFWYLFIPSAVTKVGH